MDKWHVHEIVGVISPTAIFVDGTQFWHGLLVDQASGMLWFVAGRLGAGGSYGIVLDSDR